MLVRTIVSRVGSRSASSAARGSFARSMATAVRFDEPGNPRRVLRREELKAGEVGPNDVLVEMFAAPVTHADLRAIETGALAAGVAGSEGLGVVTKVGSSVKGVKAEDWVIPGRTGFGTWRTEVVAPADSLLVVAKTIPQEEAASLVPAMVASRLLSQFAQLGKGDWVVQNCANSAVGKAVIQLARERGLKTLNVVRSRGDTAAVVDLLKDFGGDVVVSMEYLQSGEFRSKVLRELPAPKLALDAAGGELCTAVARPLAAGGVLVAYGNASRKGVRVPTSALLERDIQVRGFNFGKWFDAAPREEKAGLVTELTGLVAADKLRSMTVRYSFDREFDVALGMVDQRGRERRPLLMFKDE